MRAILDGSHTPVAIFFVLTALFLASPPHAQTIVPVETGKLQGVTEEGITYLKGISYAEPPVRNLRRRPPQPPQSWKGIRSATHFGLNCMKLPTPSEVSLERAGVRK
jgi:para-nitrobenzyl esterase